jgi:hypothetical protein
VRLTKGEGNGKKVVGNELKAENYITENVIF